MWTPLISSLFIFLFGLVNLFGIKPDLVLNQFLYLVIGLVIFYIVKNMGWRFFRDNATVFYWIFIVLLLATFLIGVEVKGSKRWIDLYFFNFQASEIFKVFFIVFIADYFSKNLKNMDEPAIFLKGLGHLALPALVIFRQPDLGNAMVYLFIFFIMLFFSRVPRRIIGYLIGIAALVAPLFWFLLKDYQRARLISFLNPHVDQAGSGYNMIQAMIAVGSGKFFGRGLGYGTQSKLKFLPENHTDFAYSSLVEQFGFFGGFIIILLYLIIVLFLIKRVIKFFRQSDHESDYKFLFYLGILAYFIFHVTVNIGMNLGLLPVTGIVLPLISYGGSATVGFLIGLALLP